jgi:hypothetical protein
MSKLLVFGGIFLVATSVASTKQQKRSTASDQEKPEAILAAAKKISENRAWRVDARIESDKQMKISGIIAGNDFDLTIETVDGTKRQITLGEKNWLSEDGAKTWKDGNAKDRRFYYLVHTPIWFSPDQKIPPHERVPPEKGEAENLLHVRFKAPQKVNYEGDRPNWWIEMENGKPVAIRRYHGPGVLEGSRDFVLTDAVYEPISDQPAVVAPPGNPHAVAGEAGPEKLLMAAMEKMNEGVWEVKGTASLSKTIKIHGLLAGKDFDLTMESEDGGPVQRQIVIGDKAWVSAEGGKSFHPGTPDDRLLYTLTHTPILSGRLEPQFEKVGTEQHDSDTWMHIRLKVDEQAEDSQLPHYWLALDAQGHARYIARAELPVINPGANDVINCKWQYAPAKERIAPPSAESLTLGAPVNDKVHGFRDIDAHKLDWAGKVVRVEVDPKLLQSAELEDNSYQAFLKDTAKPQPSYGVVEFPGDALVKLGFLKKIVNGKHAWEELGKIGALGRTEGQPVSFYVQIIFLGERPAARCIAVGSKLSEASDGKTSYAW